MGCDYIKTLKLVQQGQWDKAHEMVQPYSDKMSCLIHAYLHRVEGDLSNANYWYRRAESKMLDNSLDQEFERLNSLVNEKNE